MSGLEAEDEAIGRSPHRIEVITGDAPRRIHSDVLKGRLVALTLSPGSCIADIARAHDLHPQLLYRWRREAKAGKLVLPACDTPDFIPVVVDDAEVASESPEPDICSSGTEAPEVGDTASSATVIVEVGGVTLRLPGDAEAARIAGIAAALREAL